MTPFSDPKLGEVRWHHFETFKLRVGIALAVIAIGCAIGIYLNRTSVEKIKTEAAQRQDQVCTIFEEQHIQLVQKLDSTYQYMLNLPEKNQNDPLTQAVLTGIPQTEQQASELPPDFCNEPGVGLSTSLPTIPKRPNQIDVLLQNLTK